ncbi:hypothetical protein [Palleronia caenipelagi]|uniref:Uncharacterized protein n=1 Tax=Palleronia caenipelagi TaxID=2489174 RepID=A0A547PJP4_9RHOB|nr:hypothetical protein [Palleronia caenipelagi]TRD14340.1 hypothetical protein FEV53_19130 [Palleronia caenipelagi]
MARQLVLMTAIITGFSGFSRAQENIPDNLIATVSRIDPNARILDNELVVASSAEMACKMLNAGLGFSVASAEDPRIIATAGYGDLEVTDATETGDLVRPEGMDECYWRALNDIAAPNDVKLLTSLFSVETGEVEIPALPVFLADPTLLGLKKNALPARIAPEFARLRGVQADVSATAQIDYYTRVAEVDAEAATRDAEAARALLQSVKEATSN